MTNDGSRKERHVEAMLAKLTGFYNGVNYTNADDVHPFHLPAQVIANSKKTLMISWHTTHGWPTTLLMMVNLNGWWFLNFTTCGMWGRRQCTCLLV